LTGLEAGLTDQNRYFGIFPLILFGQKAEQTLSFFWEKIERTLIIIGSKILERKR
jgi:hypothetical protein